MPKLLKYYYWLPAFIWMLVIFTFSSQPTFHTSPVTWQDFIFKKTAHFIEFAVLDFLLVYALAKTTNISWIKILFIAAFVCFLYGASDEYHQYFVAGRQPRIQDVFIDGLGSLSVSTFLLRYPSSIF